MEKLLIFTESKVNSQLSGLNKLLEPINNLDSWANKTIKTSFLAYQLNRLLTKVNLTSSLLQKVTFYLFLFSATAIFVSLSLPQFASDRFGIGIEVLVFSLFFLFYLLTNKAIAFKFNFIDFLIIIFMLILTISTFNSYFFKESLSGLFKYITYICWYFSIKTLLLNSSRKILLYFFSILFLSSIIVSLIGLYQYAIGVEPLATWEDMAQENIHTRIYSTLGNPNLLCGYLLLIFPIGIVLSTIPKNLLLKALMIFSNLIILLAISLTGSRGGYIGLISIIIFGALALFNYFLSKNQKVNKLQTIIALVFMIGSIASVFFLFPVVIERLQTLCSLRDHSSNNYRVNVWLSSLQMLKDNWVFGIGPGNNAFFHAYGLYMKSGFDALAAYNIFLEIGVETGFLGILIFIFIFIFSFLKLHFIFFNRNQILGLGIACSLIGLLAHGIFDTVFYRPQLFIPFWFLLASIDKIEEN